MKARYVAAILTASAILVWALVSCNMNPVVSIDQRISTFQSDLNSNRSNAYENFHPDQTQEYPTLLNSSVTIDTLFPAGSPSYTFQTTDESAPATGVLVTVISSPSTYGSNLYLKLVMATYKDTDWRIVKLFMSTTTTFSATPTIF